MYETGLKTSDGEPVLSYEFIESLREADKGKNNPYRIIAQRGAQEAFLNTGVDIMIGGGSRGGPLLVDTKVVTPFGYRRIGDLKTGDIISATDGGMQRVVYRQDHGKLPAYRLTFIDGSSVIASYDHLWNIRRTCYISKKRHLNGLDLKDDWRVWTTQMIVDFLKNKKDGKLKNGHIVIPLCEPVKFTVVSGRSRKSAFDPYVYGALIGNGCMTDCVISNNLCQFENMPNQVVDELAASGIDMSHFSVSRDSQSYQYRIKDERLIEDLKFFGLAGCSSAEKFIPKYFKFGTVEERFAIVQGLMDTDGTIDSRGHCSYTTISRKLAEDMKFMINSLGGIATIAKNKAGYKDKNGNYVQCNDAYDVYIRIKDSERLFRLPYKKERCREYNGGVSEYTRRIVDFEYLGEMDCCCIAVDNANSLFMVEDFVVTHNSKSFSLLMEALKDIKNPYFNATILRNEKDDLLDIINTSYILYSQFGNYNKSQNDMTWYFDNGGKLKFSYYADNYEDFKKRFQGKQYCYIGIDEITHCPYEKFKYLITNNRNAFGIKNRFWGTCNPDPDSWVRKFIDWWIGEDGFPIPERNGVIRYCYMDGDTPDSIYWGDTPEEVYEQCKSIIDPLWNEAYEELGFNKITLFVKSVTFIKASLVDNLKLLESDPNYIANLAQQDEEQRSRDLEGNWNFKSTGDDMIKMDDMERFYRNPEIIGDGRKRVTCDVAFDGGDSLVMWLWRGWHIEDIFVCRLDSKGSVEAVRAKLNEWGVLEEDFTYDLNGVGQTFKGYFKRAVPFNNRESVDDKLKNVYDTIKSQSAYLFAKKLINGEISINPRILDYKFSGKGFEKVPLRQILMKERKCIRADENASDKGFCIIKKAEMKKIIGHSPDYFESLFMRMIFEIKQTHYRRPKGLLKYTKPFYR